MKVNVMTVIKNIEGVKMKNGDKDLTLQQVIANVMGNQYANEELNGATSMERYKIARKAYSDDLVDFTIEDLKLIKELVGRACPAMVTGFIYDVIEDSGKQVSEEKPVKKLAK